MLRNKSSNFRKVNCNIVICLSLFFVAGNSAYGALGFPDCPGTHCSEYSNEINTACKAAGKGNRDPFPVVGPKGSVCTCPCSCMVAGTLVQTSRAYSELPVEGFDIGHVAYNPIQDLVSMVDNVLASKVTNSEVMKITFDDGATLQVSPNHTFISNEEKVVSARDLREGMLVLNSGLNSVAVTSNQSTSYSGDLYNLIINENSSLTSDHIIVTNGILSGDWLVQSVNDAIESEISLRMNVIKPYDLNSESRGRRY